MLIEGALSCFYDSMKQYDKLQRMSTRSSLYLLDEGHSLYIYSMIEYSWSNPKYIISYPQGCDLEILNTLSQKTQ